MSTCLDKDELNDAEPLFSFPKLKEKLTEMGIEIGKAGTCLELCGFCRNLLLEDERYRITNSTDFVDILKEVGDVQEPTLVELDFYGYVKDWEQISLAYRTKKNFTCERCGIQIDDPFDRSFIHTHHRNGDKTDNRELNLECLCIKCHSEIDEVHEQNFLRGGNKVLLENFYEKYH